MNLENLKGLVADYAINEKVTQETAEGIQMLIAALDDVPYLVLNTKITDIETLKVIAYVERCNYYYQDYTVTKEQTNAIEELLNRKR